VKIPCVMPWGRRYKSIIEQVGIRGRNSHGEGGLRPNILHNPKQPIEIAETLRDGDRWKP